MGGVGNQLFQIASTYAHAREYGFECGFDLQHTYLPLQGKPASTYIPSLYATVPQIKLEDYNLNTYKEPHWEYHPIPPKDNVLLNGYFQSPRHFDKYRKEILDLFLNDEVDIGIVKRLEYNYSVELKNSISAHVRRGDYLKFPNIHPTQGTGYYLDAIRSITAETGDACILIFSDDILWCKENFRGANIRFIEGLPDYEDMILMSLCKHNVISNSSFSWWGSYLNKNPDKIVYAPKLWNCSGKHKWDDIYLPAMRLL